MRSLLRTCVTAWAVALVAMQAGVTTAGAEEPGEGTFTALTYNVAGLPEGLSGSNPSVNTPLISPLLNDYDLVLVQEDWADPEPPIPGIDFFHDDLVSQVTHPYLSAPAPAPQGQDPRRPSALVSDGLNRMSRFPFGTLTRVMWPNCFGGADTSDGGAADCLSQKGFSVARTQLAPGIEVDVYNLHAEAGSTALDDQYSAEDFQVLAAHIVRHSAGRAVIVGGDFNLHTDRPFDGEVFDSFLAATGLVDVCAVVDCGADADEIDKFVFRSGGGVTLDALTHRFERDKFVRDDGEPLSDHDALAVTFRWTRQEPGTIGGTVTGPGGAPVAGAVVDAFGPGDTWLPSFQGTTDTSGLYLIEGVTPGTYVLRVRPPAGSGLGAVWHAGAPARPGATPVTVPVGGPVVADEALASGASIAGAVTDPSGAPRAGVAVWAYAPSDTWVGTAVVHTGADGTYELVLPPGTYRVAFRPQPGSGLRGEWFDGAVQRRAAHALAATAGLALAGIDATLDRS